jgi:hypothetical protein
MKSPAFSTHNRRTFLKYLAGSPYVAALGGIRAFAERALEITEVIADPKEAFSVMYFEEATRRKADPVHWAFLASGVDDDVTLRANREGFQHIQLRPRQLRDASKVGYADGPVWYGVTTAPYSRAPPSRLYPKL